MPAVMTDAERWHAANAPVELHSDPYQIVLEGVHSNMTGERGKRFCLHLFPDASALDCKSGPLRFIDASGMVMFGRFRQRDFGKTHNAATEWCLLVERLEDLGIDVPTPAEGARAPRGSLMRKVTPISDEELKRRQAFWALIDWGNGGQSTAPAPDEPEPEPAEPEKPAEQPLLWDEVANASRSGLLGTQRLKPAS